MWMTWERGGGEKREAMMINRLKLYEAGYRPIYAYQVDIFGNLHVLEVN